MKRHIVAVPALLTAGLLTLTACSSSDEPSDATTDGTIAVVASTNVWGDIVSRIGGDHVSVTSLIDNPDRDPHEYEADAQNQLALSKAGIVVVNGGGYDDFVDTMLEASDNADATVLNAVDISGKTAPADGELNEHVWYDFPTVKLVAEQVQEALTEADADNAADYEANAAAFTADIDGLIDRESTLEEQVGGTGVAITEPVPLYIVEAMGLENRTPDEFSEAIEEDTDVPPAVLADTLALFTGGEVDALIYNEQTTGPQTEQVLDAAEAAGVAVIPVTETLPDGDDYVAWMTDNLDAVASALGA